MTMWRNEAGAKHATPEAMLKILGSMKMTKIIIERIEDI
jgi:hypothetical protein